MALDQHYVYNRFGAFNPVGMVYALERDVVPDNPGDDLIPGKVKLRDGKRPRPLVLRANVGDTLEITFTNLLDPGPPSSDPPAGPSSPATRSASIHVDGLNVSSIRSLGGNVGNVANGQNGLAAPGQTITYTFVADREGTFLMRSAAAMSGGQGDGGQLGLGLFGAINVEPAGAIWYRSQVTHAELASATVGTNPNATPRIDYATQVDGVPVLAILDPDTNEIVHGDLNAIITGYTQTEAGTPSSKDQRHFREFTVLFHDELEVVQAFPELATDPALIAVRDAFGINFGSAGLGAELLANRKRIGPTKNCVDCKYEDFFLTSWANGDPALVLDEDDTGAPFALYPDDPSNVHHGYLGDPTRIRNIHAGPKETHVFHLHAHQWLRSPSNDNGSYLDSQSIGPGAAFTYDINYGGGGNRNLTPGDAILHCHLYPHFAQGMWGLWRVHDVFENGAQDRNLPDGEIVAGTPTPAVVPIPTRAMPPMPTSAMPGYPHYIAANAGHRPPQPPLDIEFDGGLGRHVITSVPDGGATFGARGKFDVDIEAANIKLLPPEGTPLEKSAMAFHAGDPAAPVTPTPHGWPAKGYPSFTPQGTSALFLVNGLSPQPGAPFADPCPASSLPARVYRAAYVQIDGVVNKSGWHDPQMRIGVLEKDVGATKSGARPPEPLFVRARSGECVEFHATNLIGDSLAADEFQIFTPTDTIGQHIHLVKFDLTSSDGAANGWNYEDATFSPEEVRARIAAANALGGAFQADGTLTGTGTRVTLTAKSHPRIAGAELGAQTTIQRWWADPLLNLRGEDRTIRTAFSHDHFAPSSHQQHGLYMGLVVEPAGTEFRDPTTGQAFGTRDDGGPTSYRADILFPAAPSNSFREFNLAVADFALVFEGEGNAKKAINPPTAKEAPLPVAITHENAPSPEAVSSKDPGTRLFNYRQEPIPLRIGDRQSNGKFVLKNGNAGRMENVFRTATHGDPFTPLLEAYAHDRVQIKLLQGAHEEQHVFSLHGNRWLVEPSDPDSGFVNSQGIGISEHMEFVLDEGLPSDPSAGASVDFMYMSTATEDLWDGLWGLMRVYRKNVPALLPLSGNNPPISPLASPPVCPPNAPSRTYRVHAALARDALKDKRLVYNERFKLYDPDAILFINEPYLAALKSGARKPEPLILRAAAGECIKVTLINDLPSSLPKTAHWNYNTPLIDGFNANQVPHSKYVSLHAQLLSYDVNDSDGASIGKNPLQTVGPGQSRTYTWYAGQVIAEPGTNKVKTAIPIEFGTVNLRDMADVVNHGSHGAFGVLVVEPQGAAWIADPGSDAQATVTYVDSQNGASSFREMVLVFQDDAAMFSDDPAFQCEDASLNCGKAIRNFTGEDDAEDSGHKAFNYRTEPIWARLGLRPETSLATINAKQLGDVLSSAAPNVDPATPLFVAKAGAPLRIRVAHPSGHGRQHAFNLWGAQWAHAAWATGSGSTIIGPNVKSFALSTQSVMSVMRSWNIVPFGGAGGPFAVPGDYLYRDQASFQFTDGLWGILRVTP